MAKKATNDDTAQDDGVQMPAPVADVAPKEAGGQPQAMPESAAVAGPAAEIVRCEFPAMKRVKHNGRLYEAGEPISVTHAEWLKGIAAGIFSDPGED